MGLEQPINGKNLIILTSQEMKPSNENCPKIKRTGNFQSKDFEIIHHMTLQFPLRKYLEIPQKINNTNETNESQCDEQLIFKNEEFTLTYAFNIPDSSCFFNSEWNEFTNQIANTFSPFFNDSSEVKTLKILQIPEESFYHFGYSIISLNLNLLETISYHPYLRIYNSLNKEKCKFDWRCKIFFKKSESGLMDVTINVEKLTTESDTIDYAFEEHEETSNIDSTHTFEYSNVSKELKLYELNEHRDKWREEMFLINLKKKTPILIAISELNEFLSDNNDLNDIPKKLRKNILNNSIDNFPKKLPIKTTVLSFEEDRESNEENKKIEIMNFITFTSRFTGTDYSQKTTNLFRHKVFFLHHDKNMTYFNIFHQEGHDCKINLPNFQEYPGNSSYEYAGILGWYEDLQHMKASIAS